MLDDLNENRIFMRSSTFSQGKINIRPLGSVSLDDDDDDWTKSDPFKANNGLLQSADL